MSAPRAMVTVREALPLELERWDDLVRRFANHRAVHLRAWIESLRASGCGQPLYLVFEQEGEVVGCLPGLLARAGPWRLFGSPLPGWQTVSLGPAFDEQRLSTRELIGALVPFLEERHRVDHIELLHSGLEPEAMQALGFAGSPVVTYRGRLDPNDSAATFARLKESARRNVRRAERLGLEVRVEEDERFVDEHYDQLREVYLRGGFRMSFPKRRMLECFRHMQAAGRLLAVGVYLPGSRITIATGMFLLEGKELLLWMWAHRLWYRWYRPTELMTWHAMQRALAAGCDTFDLMGAGDFKGKFGAEPDASKIRWVRSRRPWITVARRVAATAYRWLAVVRGRATQVLHGTRQPQQATACVMGDIDLVRALGLAHVPCAVAAPPGAAARFSRATRATIDWVDPWERSEELVESLVQYGLTQPEPPVLFYGDDAALLLLSRWRDRLRQAFRFVIPDAPLVEALVDKAQFQELAHSRALPVPAARALDPEEDPREQVQGLAFPLVLKPLTRRPDRWDRVAGGAKAVHVESLQALRDLWPRLGAARGALLAQELVVGPETCIESYHVYVGPQGEVVGEFTGRKIRTAPAAFGDSTALEITDSPDVTTLGRDLVKRLGLRGVAKLDFKRAGSPDGPLFLLEVNPRFSLWHHPGALAGVNIPALVYADLLGLPRAAKVRARAGVQWCRVWADVGAARAAGVPLRRWLPWAVRADAKRAFAWNDPLPLFGAALWKWLAPAPPNGNHGTHHTNGVHSPKKVDHVTTHSSGDPS